MHERTLLHVLLFHACSCSCFERTDSLCSRCCWCCWRVLHDNVNLVCCCSSCHVLLARPAVVLLLAVTAVRLLLLAAC
jgi:hypothetical protein